MTIAIAILSPYFIGSVTNFSLYSFTSNPPISGFKRNKSVSYSGFDSAVVSIIVRCLLLSITKTLFSSFASVIFTISFPFNSVGAGVLVPAYNIFNKGIGSFV